MPGLGTSKSRDLFSTQNSVEGSYLYCRCPTGVIRVILRKVEQLLQDIFYSHSARGSLNTFHSPRKIFRAASKEGAILHCPHNSDCGN